MIPFLDSLTLVFLSWMGWLGFKRGLVEELGRLLGLILATLVTLRYYGGVAQHVQRWAGLEAGVALLVSYAALFAATLVASRFVVRLIHYLIVAPSVRGLNRIMGFAFGAAKGAVVVALVVWIIDLTPMDRWSQIVQTRSTTARWLSTARVQVIQSFGWNDPVQRGEALVKSVLEQSLQQESDP
jgi:membrane protein required for colicin V production